MTRTTCDPLPADEECRAATSVMTTKSRCRDQSAGVSPGQLPRSVDKAEICRQLRLPRGRIPRDADRETQRTVEREMLDVAETVLRQRSRSWPAAPLTARPDSRHPAPGSAAQRFLESIPSASAISSRLLRRRLAGPATRSSIRRRCLASATPARPPARRAPP